MEIKDGVILKGVTHHIIKAIVEADVIWKVYGRDEGVTVTSGLDGTHSENSLHYDGNAVDFRTRYFDEETKQAVFAELKEVLGDKDYDFVYHSTHIHVEYDPK